MNKKEKKEQEKKRELEKSKQDTGESKLKEEHKDDFKQEVCEELEECFGKEAHQNKTEKDLETLFKDRLEKCEAEKQEIINTLKKEKADFINYKKEEKERLSGLLEYSMEEIIMRLLLVLDNFDIAEKQAPPDFKDNSLILGFLNIKKQIFEILHEMGVEEINCLDKKFDPNFHEAVAMVESDKEQETIIEEVQKGYLFRGKLIRPARVKVSK